MRNIRGDALPVNSDTTSRMLAISSGTSFFESASSAEFLTHYSVSSLVEPLQKPSNPVEDAIDFAVNRR